MRGFEFTGERSERGKTLASLISQWQFKFIIKIFDIRYKTYTNAKLKVHLARVISLLRARTVPFGLRYYLHPQAYSWNPVYAPFIFKALLAVFISKATDAVVYFRQMTSRVQFDIIILKWLCLNTIIRERQHLIALQREWGGGVSIISPSQSMRQPDYVNNCANSARNTVRPYASNSTQYLHYISFLPEKKNAVLMYRVKATSGANAASRQRDDTVYATRIK